jgi:flagellar FliL protein
MPNDKEETKDREGVKEKEEAKVVGGDNKPGNPMIKLITIVLALLVIGGGGYFGWNIYTKEAETNPEVKEKEVEKAMVYPLKSFVVNLYDKKGIGKRYLKVTVELEYVGEENKITIDDNIPQLRDAILILLSNQTLRDINTIEGKLELKHELLSRMNQVFGEGIIRRIYFTEFVVQ